MRAALLRCLLALQHGDAVVTLGRAHRGEQTWLIFLVFFYIVACCLSLASIATHVPPNYIDSAKYHLFFDTARLPQALLATGAFSLTALMFAFARFSIGYFAGFCLYSIVLGYLWLVSFTDLQYDHRLAAASAALSAVAFLLPSLFGGGQAIRAYRLSEPAFDRLLLGMLVFAALTAAIGSTYHFRLVALTDIYAFRGEINLPTLLNYALGIVSYALLPFVFAGFIVRRRYWGAVSALVVLLLLYPVTLSKISLLAPFWLLGVLILSKLFTARIAVILSMTVPVAGTLVLAVIFKNWAVQPYVVVAFRMIAIPASALDIYSDFFSSHELTHFCQISVLKHLMHCPYPEPLALVMAREYGLGNFNASLFATEGIASVGFYLAPVSALLCGLVLAIGNRLSSELPPAFVLVSGAMLPQSLINVPLSIALVTNGGALLFLLWLITPRTIFEKAR